MTRPNKGRSYFVTNRYCVRHCSLSTSHLKLLKILFCAATRKKLKAAKIMITTIVLKKITTWLKCYIKWFSCLWQSSCYLLSSLKVNLPIWANFLKGSRQMTPAHSILMMATWSCFTKRGRVFDFSPVFLSTKQIRACTKTVAISLLVNQLNIAC